MGQIRANALARSEHAVLLAAIVAALAAGIVAAILLPTAPMPHASRENGSLLAPPSDDSFSAAFGAPAAPSSLTGGEQLPGGSGKEEPAPAPRKPSPAPGPGTPPPPPPDNGLLGLLDDLPILPPPPPLPGVASTHAAERLAMRGVDR